jgi:hypothetical protein
MGVGYVQCAGQADALGLAAPVGLGAAAGLAVAPWPTAVLGPAALDGAALGLAPAVTRVVPIAADDEVRVWCSKAVAATAPPPTTAMTATAAAIHTDMPYERRPWTESGTVCLQAAA